MHVIKAENVADAWAQALVLIQSGQRQESRNGAVTVMGRPVTTEYARPCERVLLDPVRDANPFLHLFESLWMLAGRDDALWLDQFVSDFSSRFAEPDTISPSGPGPRLHGAYGRRWRGWFPDPFAIGDEYGHFDSDGYDQLDKIVELLRANPDDRQAVLTMWSPETDLGVPGLKDRPCNTHAYLRVREASQANQHERFAWKFKKPTVLDLTVCCRSNDVVFGCYGANAVHFSVLQEYLAARIGVGVGTYYQVSNNWHLYDWARDKCEPRTARHWAETPYPGTLPLVDDSGSFDDELRAFMEEPENNGRSYRNGFLQHTAMPMWMANANRKCKNMTEALTWAQSVAAPDWREACVSWLQRRVKP